MNLCAVYVGVWLRMMLCGVGGCCVVLGDDVLCCVLLCVVGHMMCVDMCWCMLICCVLCGCVFICSVVFRCVLLRYGVR